jgi:hypothetical protein
MENFLKKKFIVPLIIILIMIASFAIRFHNFDEWLYFKMDQARDAFTIAKAVENGPLELPLLGARAGATEVTYGFLNLGPIFYYFQYLSGIIFNSTSPEVFAYPDLFFSVAVLPLLYVFCRIYFQRHISILIVLMYAFSFLVIQYSRFAWNPNSLPFFTILSFLALLKFLSPEKEKHRKWWIMLWSVGLAIGSQLHFVGFFSLVGVSGLLIAYHFNLWKKREVGNVFRKKSARKIGLYSGLALAVFLFFYTPVIISDVMKNGENAKNFVQAISSKPSEKSFVDKFSKNISQQVRYQTLVLTSFVYPKKINLKNSFLIIFTAFTFLAGICLAIKNIRKSTDESRKNFLALLLLWFSVYFILCVPLAYSIRPRFFIFTFALPFIFLGLLFEFLDKKFLKRGWLAISILTVFVLFSNASGTLAWFKEQADSQEKHLSVKRTLILKNKDGVTLGQLERAADYIFERRVGDSRIYFYVKPEHVRPFRYLFSQKKDPDFEYEQFKINSDPKAQYFAVVPSHYEKEGVAKKMGSEFDLISNQQFGQISVWEVVFPERSISDNFESDEDSSGSASRLFWKDVFGLEEDSRKLREYEDEAGDEDSGEDLENEDDN